MVNYNCWVDLLSQTFYKLLFGSSILGVLNALHIFSMRDHYSFFRVMTITVISMLSVLILEVIKLIQV